MNWDDIADEIPEVHKEPEEGEEQEDLEQLGKGGQRGLRLENAHDILRSRDRGNLHETFGRIRGGMNATASRESVSTSPLKYSGIYLRLNPHLSVTCHPALSPDPMNKALMLAFADEELRETQYMAYHQYHMLVQ